MLARWLRRVGFAVALLAVVPLIAGSPVARGPSQMAAFGMPPRPPATGEAAPLQAPQFGYFDPGSPDAGCARDPASLPPPPPSPTGAPANYLHTCSNRIYDSLGRQFTFFGVNWYGLENREGVPQGLRQRNWREVLDQIAALGYNSVRLPFSSDTIAPGHPLGAVDFGLNPDLQGLSGLEFIDRFVAACRERGLRVVLDRHRTQAGVQTSLWYSSAYPDDKWISDWRMLAARYAGNDTVVAVDLHNEPHGQVTWGTGDQSSDWRLAAERAGNAVHEANPYLLVFVEGIETYRDDSYWWGGQLMGVRDAPVRLQVPNRVVYSPHDYGPSVYEQAWFRDPAYPANMPAIWDRHWGYIHDESIAPLVVGEFGETSVGTDRKGQWLRTMLEYLGKRGIGFLMWSLNPNGETGGVLGNDWRTVDLPKQGALASAAAGPFRTDGPGGVTPAGDAGVPSARRVAFRQIVSADPSPLVSFEFQIENHSAESLDLSRCELRYWYSGGDLGTREQLAFVAPSGSPNSATGPAEVNVVADLRGGQSHYLRVRFGSAAGVAPPFGQSGAWRVELMREDLSTYVQANDFSFARQSAADRLDDWDRVALYVDGQRVWGREP